MTDREMKVFLLLMLGIHVVEVAGEILGLDIEAMGPVCSVYRVGLLFFLLGYGLKRLCRKEQFPIFAVPGSFGLAMDVAADIGLSWWVPKLPISRRPWCLFAPEYFFCFEYYGGKVPVWAGKLGMLSAGTAFPSI